MKKLAVGCGVVALVLVVGVGVALYVAASKARSYLRESGVVDSLHEAVAHIERFGSGHTEVIVTSDRAAAGSFLASVDAASVRVNAPTGSVPLFATQKSHARGPLEPASFTTTKSVTWH